MSDETPTEEAHTTTQTPTKANDSPKFSERLRALLTGAENDRMNDLLSLLIADAEKFGF